MVYRLLLQTAGEPLESSYCEAATGRCYLFKFLYCFVQLKTTTPRQLLCFWCSSVSTSVWLLRRRTSTTRSSHSWLGKPCHWSPDLTTCLPFHVVWSPLLMTTKLVHTHSVFFFMSANQVIFRVGVFKTSIQVSLQRSYAIWWGSVNHYVFSWFPNQQLCAPFSSKSWIFLPLLHGSLHNQSTAFVLHLSVLKVSNNRQHSRCCCY